MCSNCTIGEIKLLAKVTHASMHASVMHAWEVYKRKPLTDLESNFSIQKVTGGYMQRGHTIGGACHSTGYQMDMTLYMPLSVLAS